MIRRAFLGLLFMSIIIFPLRSYSELYLGIGPLDTLENLKKRFPNASFERKNPAWAQEEDVMYWITGPGISGAIIVNFFDIRPYWKQKMQEEQDENKKEFLKQFAEGSDDNITVSWVRWLPDIPFPVSRLIHKYGKPEVSDFLKDNFQPYKEWKKRGILATLSDDGKNVLSIEFGFTKKEQDEAWKRKYGRPYPKNINQNPLRK